MILKQDGRTRSREVAAQMSKVAGEVRDLLAKQGIVKSAHELAKYYNPADLRAALREMRAGNKVEVG